jgi:hypothetical protein
MTAVIMMETSMFGMSTPSFATALVGWFFGKVLE